MRKESYFPFLLLFLFFVSDPSLVRAEILIISNSDVADTILKKEDIRLIFLGQKKRWNDSSSVTPAILTDSEAYEQFLKEFIQKSPSQFLNYWKQQLFTGKNKPPLFLDTAEKLIGFVSETRGSIGYLDMETFNKSKFDKSKISIIAVK